MVGALLLTSLLTGCFDSDSEDSAVAAAPETTELTILHINDHHSRLDAETTTLTLKNAANTTKTVTVDLGGFARVKTAIDTLAAKSPNVLKLHAGDAITGDLYYTLTDGQADAAMMNTVCFDAFALGNHEFDSGNQGLVKFLDFLGAGSCKTPILSSNVKPVASDPLASRILPHAIVERGGKKFGIVGVTIKNKTQNASRPDVGTLFDDEVSAVQNSINTLKNQGVAKIIVLSHQGYDADKAMAPKLTDVDIIVGGDSHTLLGPDSLKTVGLSPSGSYPTTATNKDGAQVCIVQAWQYSYAVGELNTKFKGDQIESCSGQPRVLIGSSFKEGSVAATSADATAYASQVAAIPSLLVTAASSSATETLAPFKAQKSAIGTQIVGSAAADLCLRRVPGAKRDTSRSKLAGCNTDPDVIAHGGNIQQLVAQAFLEQGKSFGGADISIQNGGGVRIDVATGNITLDTVYTLLPFKNVLVRLTMTGAEVKSTLEDAVDSVISTTGTGTGAYPYAAGLRWSVDMNQVKGARISGLQFKDVSGNWVSFDLNATYRVITNDFTAGGGDNYLTLKGITGARYENTYLDYADSFLQYVKANQSLGKPAISDYSTQLYIETP
ncbi:MAG: 5'-nucleotidase C-terminal domain-containing protein [Rhodocyclaceae bacterium]|nr:5'-nucleotidase C-terminal domain-containing protein [Rhodocyclaceae bacterium]